jgi:hypothetical protein
VAADRPEGMTSNTSKEKSFEATDILFRGDMISAPAENIVDSYMHLFTAQEMWPMRLQQNSGSLMQVVSCIL